MSKPTVAVFGTGLMGKPLAIRLLDAGYKVVVWNRTPEKAASLGIERVQTMGDFYAQINSSTEI